MHILVNSSTSKIVLLVLFLFTITCSISAQEGNCGDGIDGPDGDGFIDCDDEDCIGDPACPVMATITVDNSYAFGFGDVNGIDPTQFYGCFDASSAGDIFNSSCRDLNTYNDNGPERFNLSGSLTGAYIYIISWADTSTYEGVLAQFSDSSFSLTSGPLPVGGSQWEVFATGNELSAVDIDHCGLGPASLLTDANAQITIANNYPGIAIPNTAPTGSASPGWVDANGPVNGLHPNDSGNGTVLYFDPFGNVTGGNYPIAAPTTPNGTCTHFNNPNAAWMWYNPDGDLDGIPDYSNPFDVGATPGSAPEGEYLIFRVGPLDELFSGCSTENPTILCDATNPDTDYNLTFDVVNNTGFDVHKLLIPGSVGGANISPNIIDLVPPLASGATATGIELNISGGNPGDNICIPIGLMAKDNAGEEFQCCGTEVCVELPSCCLLVSNESITFDAAGNAQYTFSITNGDGEDPILAEHLFMDVISPAGVSIVNEWQPLNSLADNSSIVLSTEIVGAQPGATICFQITIHDETLNTCCGIVHCVTMPDAEPGPCIPQLSCKPLGDIDGDNVLDILLQWPVPSSADCCPGDLIILVDGVQVGSANPMTGSATVPCTDGVYCIACSDAAGNLVVQACCDAICNPFLPPTVEFLRGDSNSDGAFDIADVIKTLNYLFHSEQADCLVALDTNDDDFVNIADAIFSLDALFDGGQSPWPPYQTCGIDETPGQLDCNLFPACLGAND